MKKHRFFKASLLFILTAGFALIPSCDHGGNDVLFFPGGAGNTPPVVNDRDFLVLKNSDKSITLIASDADYDPLTWHIDSSPEHGTLMTLMAPDIFYKPDTDYLGSDSFTFHVNDGTSDSNIATINLSIVELHQMPGPHIILNRIPVANDQSVNSHENITVDFSLTASDADGDPLTWHIDSDPSHGTVGGTAPNLSYTPDGGYTGSDSFTFHVNDGSIDSDPATVNISVISAEDNIPPVAYYQTIYVDEDTLTDITLTAIDADGNPLTWHIDSNPWHGTLSGGAPDMLYEPDPNYHGRDQFMFHVDDGLDNSNTSVVIISISSADDGDIFYVVPNGAGDEDGSSWDNAFAHPQDAVDFACSGEKVWVKHGTYYRRSSLDTVLLTMKNGVDIYGGFSGTESTLEERNYADSTAVFHGQDAVYHVVVGASNARLDGFTLTGGDALTGDDDEFNNTGGGMVSSQCTDLIIANCRFIDNRAAQGGGMHHWASHVAVESCFFDRNRADAYCGGGGAITLQNGTTVISNCLIINNYASHYGAGIVIYYNSNTEISNCTFSGNNCSSYYSSCIENVTSYSNTEIFNSIMWGNQGREIYNPDLAAYAVVTYSDIEDGYPLVGNIDSDPLFVTGPRGDYYLRHSACQGFPYNSSPCIDAGDNTAASYGLDTKKTATCSVFDTGTVDMGYHYEP